MPTGVTTDSWVMGQPNFRFAAPSKANWFRNWQLALPSNTDM